MKQEKRNMILAIATVVVLGLVVLVFFNLPKPVTASNAAFDLTEIVDGIYPDTCDNGLVKVRVEVAVQNREITEVKLLEHDNGLGDAAEAITDTIVQQQSLEVDAISGATMSSKTILKAVENALSEGRQV